ncbi:Ig-like domain-containing protein [Phenylobacterium sp.]|uniref:Ig-like domain-containing protein n=1 Tax=Phenylobacterium sp. TaxID=1871053 RepID=UPI00272F6226|nr:Ig-like domain-containing protein [Phenylobacterium sp.]MDP1616825.1 Ig-like domain-containing protein [Phenylobacterium sp.]MDP1988138.1 Ig-like domain-containing protein [Phenylobacterium sp.]
MAAPTVDILVADASLIVGESSTVTFTFSEPVQGFAPGDLTVGNGLVAGLFSADGGTTWTGTLIPNAGVTDASNVITADLTGVTDLGGTPGIGTASSNNYAVDTVRPTASIVVANTVLGAGDASTVTFTFSEAVTGFTAADLTVENGTVTWLSSSDGGVTWTGSLSPTANVSDSTNVITLNNAGYTDLAGNTGLGTSTSGNYSVESIRPTATVVVADAALAAGETSLVTITFSEAVNGFDNADLTVVNGALGVVSSTDGGVTWTATLTPSANVSDATNLITLNMFGVTNGVGNAGAGTISSNNYAIDTVRPTASIVVADTALAADETSQVTFTFSEAVSGFSTGDLTVANGVVSGLSSSDGGITWAATLTPTAGVTDTTNLITLDMTGVVDAAGNAGAGTADSNNYAIDTARPTASIVVADTALRAGDTSQVTFTFSEAVTGFTTADLTVANGLVSGLASSDGGITWTATLTPTAATTDTTNVVTLNNAGVTDAAGNTGTGTTSSNNYAIDTLRPTASILVADTALAVGETSLVTFTFSEAVSGFSNGDLTVVNGTLTAVSSADGGVTWTATLTPSASISDTTNVITLDNTGVIDAAGNGGTGTTASNNYAIDTLRPTASIVVADTALQAGETSQVTITFSEAVTGFSNDDLTVANGTLSAVSSADGGVTWTATLTPSASVSDATNLIVLDNAGVADLAGNSGAGTTESNNYAIDTVAAPPPPPSPPPTQIFGTPFSEFITGNALDNTIDAGGGNDTVTGEGGADLIDGGEGDDVLQGNTGSDTIYGGLGDDLVLGGKDSDFLQGNVGADNLFGDMGDDTVHGGQGADQVQGGLGDDIIFGDAGNDTVRGGQGDDIVFGGLGDDFLSGDRGNDTLTGGEGADLFHTFDGAGLDVVTDFNLLEGDRVLLAPGVSYVTAQVGDDTVITLSGGDQMILEGVRLADLGDNWIMAG